MGLELTSEEIEALESRTEGWIAGLQLAALSLQGRTEEAASDFITSFTGSHHYVIDYLTDEVLARLAESVQRFLLHTPILDRLSASLCACVMDEETMPEATMACQELLEDLELRNLFLVALDELREWYRYHHLFAEAIRHRFRQLEPDRVDEVYQRASLWFEQQGLLQEAVEYALDAGNVERAAGLIERLQSTALTSFSNMTLWRFLDRLPDEVMFQHPILWANVRSGSPPLQVGAQVGLAGPHALGRSPESAWESAWSFRGKCRRNRADWPVDTVHTFAALSLEVCRNLITDLQHLSPTLRARAYGLRRVANGASEPSPSQRGTQLPHYGLQTMLDLFSTKQLTDLIATYGYWAVLLVVAIESMGVPVPGETTLLTASVYAGATHRLQIAMVIAAAAAGAILGDNLGYLLGRLGGSRLLQRYGRYVRLDERRLRLGRYLFQRHGGMVVFFGRFVAVLRAWAAFLAGTNRMSWPRFLAFNATGGMVWATLMGLAGYAFGSTLLHLGGPIAAVSTAVTMVIMTALLLLLRRNERRLQREADRGFDSREEYAA